MAHFAELDLNNIVLRVLCLDNSVMENDQGDRIEQLGVDFLKSLYGQETIWKQTSYNTKGGIHYDPNTNQPSQDQSKAFRKNYAGIGYVYDLVRDAFIAQKPDGEGWYFDEDQCIWKNPEFENKVIEVTRV